MKIANKDKELKVLTIEEIKNFKGLESLTDEQATQIATALKELSLLSYQMLHFDSSD